MWTPLIWSFTEHTCNITAVCVCIGVYECVHACSL